MSMETYNRVSHSNGVSIFIDYFDTQCDHIVRKVTTFKVGYDVIVCNFSGSEEISAYEVQNKEYDAPVFSMDGEVPVKEKRYKYKGDKKC